MLVLSRRADESIVIGDDIEVTIVEIRGDRVRLGISAPDRVAVHRKEIYLSIRDENIKAGENAAGGIEGAVRLLAAEPRNRGADRRDERDAPG